jgi:hypothetical protein
VPEEKNLYTSQNITKGTRLAGHIANVEAVRNAYTAVGAEAEWERPNGKHDHGWQYSDTS